MWISYFLKFLPSLFLQSSTFLLKKILIWTLQMPFGLKSVPSWCSWSNWGTGLRQYILPTNLKVTTRIFLLYPAVLVFFIFSVSYLVPSLNVLFGPKEENVGSRGDNIAKSRQTFLFFFYSSVVIYKTVYCLASSTALAIHTSDYDDPFHNWLWAFWRPHLVE